MTDAWKYQSINCSAVSPIQSFTVKSTADIQISNLWICQGLFQKMQQSLQSWNDCFKFGSVSSLTFKSFLVAFPRLFPCASNWSSFSGIQFEKSARQISNLGQRCPRYSVSRLNNLTKWDWRNMNALTVLVPEMKIWMTYDQPSRWFWSGRPYIECHCVHRWNNLPTARSSFE
jgi:hypothetical protein